MSNFVDCQHIELLAKCTNGNRMSSLAKEIMRTLNDANFALAKGGVSNEIELKYETETDTYALFLQGEAEVSHLSIKGIIPAIEREVGDIYINYICKTEEENYYLTTEAYKNIEKHESPTYTATAKYECRRANKTLSKLGFTQRIVLDYANGKYLVKITEDGKPSPVAWETDEISDLGHNIREALREIYWNDEDIL